MDDGKTCRDFAFCFQSGRCVATSSSILSVPELPADREPGLPDGDHDRGWQQAQEATLLVQQARRRRACRGEGIGGIVVLCCACRG